MIILRGDPSEFRSWDELIRVATTKKVSCPDVTHRKFLNALLVLSSVAHSNFFTNTNSEFIYRLLNQINHYRSGEHFSFVDEIFGIAKLIRLLRKDATTKGLFRAHIFRNFGMYSQFLITAYLAKRLKIEECEANNPPLFTDILASHKNQKIHFHIKDIREKKREERVSDTIYFIEHVLSNKARVRNAKKRLAVGNFLGVPPEGLERNYWDKVAESLEEKPQTYTMTFLPGGSTKNTEPIEVKFTLIWRDYSGIFTSASKNFNNQMRLSSEYDSLNKKIQSSPSSTNEVHVLVAVTEDKYNWKRLRQTVKKEKVGLVLFNVIEFTYERSPFMLSEALNDLESELNRIFPECIEFVFK